MTLFAALDIGTTSVKVIVCDSSGNVLTEATSRGYPVYTEKAGWAEQNPEDWWLASCEATHRVLKNAEVDGNEIVAVASDSHTDGCTPVDVSGRSLSRSLIWVDRRASKQCPRENEMMEEIYRVTGLACDPYHVAPKIVWLRDNRREVYEKTHKFLNPNDYILFKLTGEFVTDYTLASCTMLFDIRRRSWSEKMAKLFEIDIDKLPKIVSSSSVVGEITPKAAEETGLKSGTLVVAGGGDEEVALVGSGAVEPGIVSDVTGGAEPIGTTTAEPVWDPSRVLELHAHPDPSLWIVEVPGIVSGENLEWFVEQFNKENPDRAQVFGLLDAEIESTPPGANGLIFLPYTSGSITPEWNAHARGAFVGISLLHRRAHFERALQEGLSFYLRDVITGLERLGLQVDKIVAAGGGAKSAVWCQIKSDVTRKTVVVPRMRSVSAYGSAMLAAVGTKHLSSLKAASDAWVKYDHGFQPSGATEKTYDNLYEAYTSAYWGLKDVFHILSEMQEL